MPGESQLPPTTEADPSVFTTEAIGRAAQAERDFVKSEIRVIETRLNAMDEATRVLSETVTRTPTDIQKEIKHLRDLMEEKFNSVREGMDRVESQRVEQKADTEKGVQDALTAAKEAVQEQTTASALATDKSEAATTKSIDQLGEKFDTAFEGQRRDVDDLKARLTALESLNSGRQAGAAEYQASSSIADEQLSSLRRDMLALTERVSKIV